jgi:hypothetical protein
VVTGAAAAVASEARTAAPTFRRGMRLLVDLNWQD